MSLTTKCVKERFGSGRPFVLPVGVTCKQQASGVEPEYLERGILSLI